ncbi:hypothetical protein AAU57_13425 [Nonlabens sp. YIK11]|nr:hypothetical protein AAU57_13425 [Nonlabens sp. YIK11]
MATFIVNAQDESGTVYLKDGTVKSGLVKSRFFGGFKFKSNESAEAIDYKASEVSGVDVDGKRYRSITIEDGKEINLLLWVEEGKKNLYLRSTTITTASMNGIPSFTTVITYYLEEGNKVTKLGRRLKKKEYSLFEDCPALIQKIKSKDIKRTDMEGIVRYYNQQCGD